MQSFYRHHHPVLVPVLMILVMLIQLTFITLKAADPEAYVLDDEENHEVLLDHFSTPLTFNTLDVSNATHDHSHAKCLDCVNSYEPHQMVPYSMPIIPIVHPFFAEFELVIRQLPAHLMPLSRPPTIAFV